MFWWVWFMIRITSVNDVFTINISSYMVSSFWVMSRVLNHELCELFSDLLQLILHQVTQRLNQKFPTASLTTHIFNFISLSWIASGFARTTVILNIEFGARKFNTWNELVYTLHTSHTKDTTCHLSSWKHFVGSFIVSKYNLYHCVSTLKLTSWDCYLSDNELNCVVKWEKSFNGNFIETSCNTTANNLIKLLQGERIVQSFHFAFRILL